MMQRKQQKREDGFTLVEIMVVVVILGLLATMAVIGVPRYLLNARNTTAQSECKTLEDAIQNYVSMSSNFDLSAEEILERVVEEDYLKDKSVPKDPWGKEYIVEFDDESQQYTVFSSGNDRIADNEDDVFANGLRKDQESDF